MNASDINNDPYEPYLHRRLIQEGRSIASSSIAQADQPRVVQIARQLFDLLMTTPVDALAREIGPILQALAEANVPLRRSLAAWALDHATAEAGLKVRWLGYFVAELTVRDAVLPLLASEE